MTRGSQLALVTLGLILILGPLLALHPAATHLYAAGWSDLSAEIRHPRVFGLVTMALISALPTAGFLLSLLRAERGRDHARELFQGSQPAQLGDLRYRRFPSDGVVIFTAGVFRPVAFASTGAERSLRPEQFRAALLHEQSHARRRDILWRLILTAVGRGFAFVPWVRLAVETETLRTECRADDYAIRNGANRRDLFEAIVAAASPSPAILAAGLTDASVELRLLRLVHPETPLPGPPTKSLLVLAAAAALPAGLAHATALLAAYCTTHYMM
ncbi:MAG: M56 family metallopeptidase [Chloroflexi bacterium]|nr:M56 family metallopeptidase [Chloroflexota bacterium]